MLTYFRLLERMHEDMREWIDDSDWDSPGEPVEVLEEMEVCWVQPGPSSEVPEGEGGLPDLPF